jgi:hypothetical protein
LNFDSLSSQIKGIKANADIIGMNIESQLPAPFKTIFIEQKSVFFIMNCLSNDTNTLITEYSLFVTVSK